MSYCLYILLLTLNVVNAGNITSILFIFVFCLYFYKQITVGGMKDDVDWYLTKLLSTYICHANPHLRQVIQFQIVKGRLRFC